MGSLTDSSYKSRQTSQTLVLAFWLLILSLSVHANTPNTNFEVLIDAVAFMENGNSKKAYELLQKYEAELSGWWEYDYVLGIAALDSGKPNISVFALQRALFMNPELVGAHVDLGRAFYQLNEYESAKTQFNKALEHKPNEKTEALVQSYLRRIHKGQRAKMDMTFNIRTDMGHDNNVNSASSDYEHFGFILDEANRQQASNFFSVSGDTRFYYRMTRDTLISGNLIINQRQNEIASFVNQTMATSTLSLLRRKRNHAFNFNINRLESLLGGKYYFKSRNGGAKLESNWAKRNKAFSLINYGEIIHTAAFRSRDVNTLSWGFGSNFKTPVNGFRDFTLMSLLSGHRGDPEISKYDKNLVRLAFNSRYKLNQLYNSSIDVTVGGERSKFFNQFVFQDRNDQMLHASLVVNSNIPETRDMTFSFHLEALNNRSSVSLYNFTRMNLFLSINYKLI
ncbi:MAG: tetratricopeptide repeat protein [Gammaproteobacteria bacterium]|nr:tetratricopeptide repeat protein [Gammaproteobacteria bacterium]MDH5730302.1 tetratricopeptide repeat protein [Gammaproteobacteria bacterium]